ncbi:extracellular solute-binding protein, partial [Pauljensenia sp. UMB3104]|uniref:extracellular solute-binding protein n=1 Tax=Pauljensenia sp. UMB3104 TaxID=3046331 RepID=UPI00254A1CDD
IWRDSFDKWNTENSDQSINVDWFANDAYKEKIRTAIGSDNAPTLVFGWGGATLRDYVEAGKVVDITDNVKDSVDKLIPSIADGGLVD